MNTVDVTEREGRALILGVALAYGMLAIVGVAMAMWAV